MENGTNKITVVWDSQSEYADFVGVTLEPIYDSYGSLIEKYLVNVDNGIEKYTVWVVEGRYVNFTVDGNRYRIDLDTNAIDRLVIQDMPATTVDFVPSFDITQLRDNLTKNIQNAMLNRVVQGIMESNRISVGTMTVSL